MQPSRRQKEETKDNSKKLTPALRFKKGNTCMEITEVRISRRTKGDAKLKAYAAVTFDDVFVVRDLKIIEGKSGLFVAMPSQKIYESCHKCNKKNPIRSKFCNECGVKLNQNEKGKKEGYRDIAHPVNSDMRSYLQTSIIDAYNHNINNDSETRQASHKSKEEPAPEPVVESSNENSEDYLSTPKLSDDERQVASEEVTEELLDTIE